MKFPIVCIVLIAFTLSACETVTWQRSGTDQQTANEDHRECRWQARLQARRALTLQPQLSSRGSAGPVRCRDRSRRGSSYGLVGDCPIAGTGGRGTSSSSLFSNRVALENNFTRRCMRGKGYELLEVEQAHSESGTVSPGSDQ